MAFPRLQELASAQNSNNLTDTMSIYIERKKNDDLYFAAGLSHLWEILYNIVNKHRLLIADLNVFGGPVALQCAEFLKQLSQTEVLKMLEIRKSVAEVHMQVHKKIDIVTVMSSVGLRIAFDPTKSPHYTFVDAGRTFCDIDIQIYSSETANGASGDRFNYLSFDHFDSAIYWNDGLHWLETENRQLMLLT
ncbi:hypothetical protein Tco_1166776 [Tanacetum coccineum]